jgi:hypothetical protein
MKKPKEKLTNKEIARVLMNLSMRLDEVVHMVMTADRMFNEYVKFTGESDKFTKYLEDKFTKDDNDTKKAKDK